MGQESHADRADDWTYSDEHGPKHWADLRPEFSACAIGEAQSPVDITNASPAALPPIEFSYRASPLKIINNGHTTQINYTFGGHITVSGETYELVQFNFHHPSEEKIDGQSYPMVAHLVLKNYAGKLAVVAVMI